MNNHVRTILFFFFTVLLCKNVALQSARGQSNHSPKATAFKAWKNGPPSDPSYFPIAVWLQNPSRARQYKEAGFNVYVGLWKGPTEEQLAQLKKADMQVICHQNEVGLAHVHDPIIVGWLQNDEPDNAQPVTDPQTGNKTYGPPVPPQKVIDTYNSIRRKDPTRPVFLNLGQGVANDEWKGRGKWGKPEDYFDYVKGCDILSFDVYPVAGIRKPDGENYLWYVAKGIQRLREWSQDEKIIWNCIECTHISNPNAKVTPHQLKAEIWMSIIHGSRGIVYFVHEFKPRFKEAALLEDPLMLKAATRINQQIHQLAPVINSPQVEQVEVQSSNPACPIALMVRLNDHALYIFSVGMRNQSTTGTFHWENKTGKDTVAVLGENRSIHFENGTFTDQFNAYDVHLYRIDLRTASIE